MIELSLSVTASLALIVSGLLAARSLRLDAPLLSVSQPTKVLVMGLALGGPFLLEELNMLPVAGGWDVVAALALSLGLFLLIGKIVGVSDGTSSRASCNT
jgi:hypothetical protein